MGQLRGKIAVFALMAGGFIAAAVAGPKPDPAPEVTIGPIPDELDIDFRSGDWTFPNCTGEGFNGCREARKGIVSVTASEGSLRSPDCGSSYPNCLSGFAVYEGDDEGLERHETLTVQIDADIKDEIVGGVTVTAAFDVRGVWLTGFVQDKNGEAGVIEMVGVDPTDRRAYSFNWNDIDPGTISSSISNGVFVNFDETVRITSAVLTATSGAFAVAGFSQRPIDIQNDSCEQGGGSSTDCKAEIAQNVFLDISQKPIGPGNSGVNGVLIKNGVYIVEDIRAPSCGYGGDTLPINLEGDVAPELVMLSHQCGYPDPADPTNKYVIYVLDLNGSDLKIEQDTIPVKFEDDGGVPGGYSCNADEPSKRPAYGWVPRRGQNEDFYEEIPILNSDGDAVIDVQDVTTGHCGSGRGGFSRFSYVAYHWVRPEYTPYEITIGERIGRLQVYLEQLFPCVQQGVNQSTLSDDAGHIRKSFDMGRDYQRTVDYIAEMREHVLAPRLNEEISQCAFNLNVEGGGYVHKSGSGVPANVVGDLLVQLDHLRWMIRTTLLGERPGEIPPLD